MANKKFLFVYILMPVSVLVVFLFSLTIGLDGISFVDVVKALFEGADGNVVVMIKQIRLPRIFMACMVGAGLAISGCVFQAILKNPLADPFTLGISGGASLGTSVAFISGLAAIRSFFIPFCAFAGMIVSVSVVYLLSMQKRFNSNAMILSGIVVSYIFSSAVMLMFALSTENSVQTAFLWLMGNFSSFDERLLPFITVVVLISIIILSLSGNIINAVSLGGEKSKTFGINIERNIKFLFLTASFVTAATVSICGVIGFVGLMIPHIMRKITGTNNVILIPASAFAGAFFLPLCDTLSRMLFSPVLIPVGVITSIIGGLFFICLLLKPDRK
ncbi:iron ABC transporter permease [Endomicrobiia bacterium]|uniref:ABC-type cobalamin (B12) transport system, permease component n=1 Tax=Endomicrobium trichonymphae TaxID=1408204 RepID=B1H097_ENDTX|nr:iron ABC transporter permease [Candidatus Endomicrobium trichonymphae]BAG13929.1 ABC-type cobalamin (B12) transport system, permease component [Candidatus Endomicrobium trichonymphae]BAV58993.1 ABC-type cobalamin (B12) transport system, permease component [Candidatus Endomicrobium trichonymphae]GHT16001.1 iron ABC transporter permease [Endomicrobiia bacterium]GHT24402.1 iron ABC transporter permease [Endomicrobiia bacterium]